jgi:hypothetical protein
MASINKENALKSKKATPSVNVKNAVRIGNSKTNPVLVRNVDEPVREPIQISGGIIFDSNGTANQPVFPVPAGKRFVIEYVSARVTVQPGLILDQFEIWSNAGGNLAHHMIASPQGNTGVSLISQPVRFYADPETLISIFVRSTTKKAVGSGNLSLTGYLVAT